VAFISGFEERLAQHAREKRCQGVICGHIHTPVMTARGDITYCNTGDWVENCSALLEFDDGELRLLRFCPDLGANAHAGAAPPAAARAAGHAAAPPQKAKLPA
jgi:hypothetical protein